MGRYAKRESASHDWLEEVGGREGASTTAEGDGQRVMARDECPAVTSDH